MNFVLKQGAKVTLSPNIQTTGKIFFKSKFLTDMIPCRRLPVANRTECTKLAIVRVISLLKRRRLAEYFH